MVRSHPGALESRGIKISIANLTDRDLVHSLASKVCPACGGKKSVVHTFCRVDYYRLSRDEQNALYNRVGHGYREAVLAALQHFKKTEATLPDPEPKPDPVLNFQGTP